MGKRSLTKKTVGTEPADDPGGRFVVMTLARLRPNKWNTKSKSRYSGPDFEELTASIESKGLIQPIVVRPVDEKDGADHEIVVGERRYRAKMVIAERNGGPGKNTIQTIVRSLTDDEAMDLTIIENLQRKDLDPLEEARQFKNYLDRHGDDAAGDLADRVGVKPGYVRRRVAVLDLPNNALKAWQKGQMTYGHLEQLRRLKDKKQIARFVAEIVERASDESIYRDPMTVRELKRDIDMESPRIKETVFDKKKAGCLQCYSNSSVQRKLFESDEDDDIKCLNPKCYKQQVNNHLSSNWESEFKPKYGTNGFAFESTVNWDYEQLPGGRPRVACKQCEKLVTIVHHDGSPRNNRVCLRDKPCFEKTYVKKKSAEGTGGGDGAAAQERAETRSRNHGVEFRELFYADALPGRMKEYAPDDLNMLHSLLLAFCIAKWECADWMIERLGLKDRWDTREVCGAIFDLDESAALDLLQDLAIDTLMKFGSPNQRREVADHIGIDLAAEWSITEAYLKKKTIAEILKMGKDLELWTDGSVDPTSTEPRPLETYAMEKYPKCRPKGSYKEPLNQVDFSKLKKAELVDVIMNSGIDLVGKVPEEILN